MKLFRWTQPVAGILAASVVFSSMALWVLFHYDTSPASVLTPHTIVAHILGNRVFWVLSVGAFCIGYYLAR